MRLYAKRMICLSLKDPIDDYDDILRMHEYLDLYWHWHDAYHLTLLGTVLHARRRDDGTQLGPSSATELEVMIRDDYDRKPVPRRRLSLAPATKGPASET